MKISYTVLMHPRVTKIISIFLFFNILIGFLVWGGKITKIKISGDFTVDPQLLIASETCLNQYIGQSFWLLSDKSVKNTVISCEKIFIRAEVGHTFPGGLLVTIYQMLPLVKIEKQDKSCTLIQNSATVISLPAEKCLLYPLPVLKGLEVENNSFVQDYAVSLIALLQENNLTAVSIELNGDSTAPWYHVILNSKTNVYLPSGANSKEKVTVLVAALNGLNTAKERYSVIDLRFDMVTYK